MDTAPSHWHHSRPVGSSARDRHPLAQPGPCSTRRSSAARSSTASRSWTRASQARNPVMFVVLVGSVLTTVLFFRDLGDSTADENVFAGLVAAFLWFTVLFANFAEAMAEGRGKAQAATLRKTRSETIARGVVAPTARSRRCRAASCRSATSASSPPAR